jgi:hypothetical protein
MGELVTDLLQARVGAERVAAVKALAKRKGMTMQSLVGKLIDEATGVASSHTDVIRPVDGSERLVELAERQVELLEQLVAGRRRVEEIAEDSVNSVVAGQAETAAGSNPCATRDLAQGSAFSAAASAAAVPAAAVDGQQLDAGVRAKSQQELEEWLNLPGSEEGVKAVVITPSPAPAEEPVKRKGNPAFAAALRSAAAAVVDQVDQDAEQVPGEPVQGDQVPVHVPAQLSASAVDSAVDVEVSVERVQPGVDVPPGAAAQIRVWRQEQVGKEAPTAPPVSSAGEWVMAARDVLRDMAMAGDLGEVMALLQLWQCPHDLMAGEVGELLAELPDYEKWNHVD